MYTDSFQVGIRGERSAEQWARTVFEGAPAPLRWFLRTGWRWVLGLRLGPVGSPEHVQGWRIDAVTDDAITLAVASPLLSARLETRVAPGTLHVATEVTYLRPAARFLWVAVVPVHVAIIRHLLHHATGEPFVLKLQRHVVNPLALRMPGQVVLETVGRRSGEPRRTPIGGRLDGSTFWLVSEFGRRSQYVRNLEADPKVRLRLRGRWRTGTASVVTDDDPLARLRRLPAYNSAVVRVVGQELLTVRVDLDDVG